METNDTNLHLQTPNNRIIITIILTFAILLSTGIYFFFKQKYPIIYGNKPSLNNTATMDTTKFTHFSSLGYELKYPPELQTKKDTTEQKVTIDIWSPPETNYNIFVTSGTDVSSIKFFTTGDKTERINVAGQQTTKTTGYTRIGTVIHIGPISYKGKQYILIYDSGINPATPESIEIFNTMVSTFTFDD